MNENLGELFAALALARQEFGDIAKSKNATIKSDKGSYSYNYADLASIIEATAPALAKHGLVIIQEPEVQNDGGRQVVIISGCIAHKSGAVYPLRSLPLPVAGSTAQAIGSAISYARRYQLTAVLNLAAADDDGNEASTGTERKPRQDSAVRPPSAQKAQQPTSTPKRTVDATTGEILEPPANANPFDDATPYYVTAWQKLTGKHYDLVNWIQQLQRKNGPCSKAQYGLVTGIVDALTNNEHNYALSVLCQAEISKVNVPSAMAVSALLKVLQKEIKGEDGVKVANPDFRQDMAAMVTEIAAQMDVALQVEVNADTPALEPLKGF